MLSSQFVVFLPAAALVAASPGANNLLAFAHGSQQGFLPSVLAIVGRCLGFALIIAVVIAGLGVLLTASALAFQTVKWVGVGYLAYLGLSMLLGRDRGSVVSAARSQSVFELARREFLVAITNPKAVLLFTAFVPQFVRTDSETTYTAQLVLLSAVYIAVEFVAATGWALAGSVIRSAHPSASRMRLLNRATGALMLAAAGLLSVVQRP